MVLDLFTGVTPGSTAAVSSLVATVVPAPTGPARTAAGLPAEGRAIGRARRDAVVAQHDRVDPQLVDQLHDALIDVALGRATRTVTADDATRLARTMPRAVARDPRWIAAVFKRTGWTNTKTYVASALPERKARPIPVWQWTGGAR